MTRGSLAEVLALPVLELEELKLRYPGADFEAAQKAVLREWGREPEEGPTLRSQLRVVLLARAKSEAETRIADAGR